MTDSLTSTELQSVRELVSEQNSSETSEIERAIATLEKHDGDIETSFQDLWQEQVGDLGSPTPGEKSIWEVTLKVLRDEVCGDDGFRSKVLDYNKNPGSASILTGAIVYLVGLTSLPINPAIATVIVLYIVKVGLNIFCEYTEPPEPEKQS
ncbi:hypothetical protein [Spirulina sp. 06S082]|uniref:hypothetical protein n=1 Tax=Spirulina sp. 06S082 TaxID=3110248 RepID=UPI002B1FD22A|nr:hypothetical protein [Spirulina sp. 06S082]MEA5470294.1 hypothetical protein [Spirulina sp. 06S082]